ncbi:MAG: hypothetical protein AAF799_22675 [Myxococcota bacterium]
MKIDACSFAAIAWACLGSLACTLGTDNGGEIVEGTDSGVAPLPTTNADGSSGSDESGQADSGGGSGGCGWDEDCGDLSVCVGGECMAIGYGDCIGVDPECGNGELDALEECDGGGDCEATCLGWIDGGSLQTSIRVVDMAVTSTGEVAAAFDPATGLAVAAVLSEGAQPELTIPIDATITTPTAVAADAADNLYVVGQFADGTASPIAVVASYAPDGSERWAQTLGAPEALDVVVDGDRVIVAGGSSQHDVIPESVVWTFDLDGASLYEIATSLDQRLVTAVIPAGPDIIGLVRPQSTASEGADRIIYWENDLSLSTWRIELHDSFRPELRVIEPDGAGGFWVGGSASRYPMVVHCDSQGNVIERNRCIGGREGAVTQLAISDTGRVAFGAIIDEDVDFPSSWFGVLDGGVTTFGRNPGMNPKSDLVFDGSTPASLRWSVEGWVQLTSTPFASSSGSNWEELFSP